MATSITFRYCCQDLFDAHKDDAFELAPQSGIILHSNSTTGYWIGTHCPFCGLVIKDNTVITTGVM